MKVLSDWQTGKPPMPGLWLTRCHEHENPMMLRWDGTQWFWISGVGAFSQSRQWQGLAFNPESAVVVESEINVHPTAVIITEVSP